MIDYAQEHLEESAKTSRVDGIETILFQNIVSKQYERDKNRNGAKVDEREEKMRSNAGQM